MTQRSVAAELRQPHYLRSGRPRSQAKFFDPPPDLRVAPSRRPPHSGVIGFRYPLQVVVVLVGEGVCSGRAGR